MFLSLLVASAALFAAEGPRIDALYNGATLAPPTMVSPGSLQVLFGEGLAGGTATATSIPLPTELLGTRVTVNGVPAPLFYVSPTQINLQVPSIPDSPLTVIVHSNGRASTPFVRGLVRPLAVGVFSLDGSGCGPSQVYNILPDGTTELNQPGRSASPGQRLRLFTTGSSNRSPKFPDGTPAPASTRFDSCCGAGLYFGDKRIGYWLGRKRAAGLIGVDEAEVQIDSDLSSFWGFPQGCNLPVYFSNSTWASQTFPLSIARGAQCEARSESDIVWKYGRVVWYRLVRPDLPAGMHEEMRVDLFRREADYAYRPLGFNQVGPLYYPPSSCPAVEAVPRLSGGTLTIQTPALEPLDLEPETVNGQPEYRYTLPNGTIVPGELKATLAGWPDTGPLTAVTRVPRPIRITTEFPRGALLRFSGLRVTWTGGEDDPDSQVRIAVHMGGRTSGDYLSVRASSGGVVVPPSLTRNATIDEIRIYQEGRLPQWMDVPGFYQFANEYLYEWRYILR